VSRRGVSIAITSKGIKKTLPVLSKYQEGLSDACA
jgi:hypothetical protein